MVLGIAITELYTCGKTDSIATVPKTPRTQSRSLPHDSCLGSNPGLARVMPDRRAVQAKETHLPSPAMSCMSTTITMLIIEKAVLQGSSTGVLSSRQAAPLRHSSFAMAISFCNAGLW